MNLQQTRICTATRRRAQWRKPQTEAEALLDVQVKVRKARQREGNAHRSKLAREDPASIKTVFERLLARLEMRRESFTLLTRRCHCRRCKTSGGWPSCVRFDSQPVTQSATASNSVACQRYRPLSLAHLKHGQLGQAPWEGFGVSEVEVVIRPSVSVSRRGVGSGCGSL